MITLNPADINSVNEDKLDETLEFKANVLRLKPEKVEYSGRRKLKAGKKATRRVSVLAEHLHDPRAVSGATQTGILRVA